MSQSSLRGSAIEGVLLGGGLIVASCGQSRLQSSLFPESSFAGASFLRRASSASSAAE